MNVFEEYRVSSRKDNKLVDTNKPYKCREYIVRMINKYFTGGIAPGMAIAKYDPKCKSWIVSMDIKYLSTEEELKEYLMSSEFIDTLMHTIYADEIKCKKFDQEHDIWLTEKYNENKK